MSSGFMGKTSWLLRIQHPRGEPLPGSPAQIGNLKAKGKWIRPAQLQAAVSSRTCEMSRSDRPHTPPQPLPMHAEISACRRLSPARRASMVPGSTGEPPWIQPSAAGFVRQPADLKSWPRCRDSKPPMAGPEGWHPSSPGWHHGFRELTPPRGEPIPNVPPVTAAQPMHAEISACIQSPSPGLRDPTLYASTSRNF